jgi:uncharacterized protein
MSSLTKPIAILIGAFLTCAPSAHARAADRIVTFQGAGGTSLAGTLVVPDGIPESKFPALVLVPGSGPTDRNGNQPPTLVTDLLKEIAVHLAEHGIASLRYDKRGMHANVGELPKDRAQYGEFFSWENFVDDVAAAYEFLRLQPEITADRVGILGHSEGGVLALAVGERLAATPARPAALVLLSTPGRSLDAVIHDQLVRLLAKQKATPEQTKYFLDENARVVQAIKDTGKVPDDVPAGLRALYPAYIGKFLQSDFLTDPSKLAARISSPVLVIAGEQDIQVSPERDAKPLDVALASRAVDDHKLLLVPEVSHNLKPVKDDTEPGLGGEIPPALLQALSDWTTAKFNK